jgi:hypothetical protein
MAKLLLGLADNAESKALRSRPPEMLSIEAESKARQPFSVEVGFKPFELVFHSIAAAPRSEPQTPALAALESPGGPDVIIGEVDEDPLPEDEEIESGGEYGEYRSSVDVIDVEIDADDYTDAPAPIQHRTTPVRRSALI